MSALVNDNEYINGLIINQNKIIFATSEKNSPFGDHTLHIHESNLQGNEIQTIFSKDGFKTHPWAYATDDVFYIEHYAKNAFFAESKLIDQYKLSTSAYENIASGNGCDLSDYFREEDQSRYQIEVIENTSPQQHGHFVITDLLTGTEKIIDDDYLKGTIYLESMEKFNYGPDRFDISNGHILLTYGIGAGDGWNYPHLVFEYDFQSNTLEYKLLAFPDDTVVVEIVYIG